MQLKLFTARLDERHLAEDQERINYFMDAVNVKKTATQFVIGQPDFWSVLVFFEDKKATSIIQNPVKEKAQIGELSTEEQQILTALKQWRKDRAKEINVPEYLICHNTELTAIAVYKPKSLEALQEIKGFGSQKVTKYGDDITAIINAF